MLSSTNITGAAAPPAPEVLRAVQDALSEPVNAITLSFQLGLSRLIARRRLGLIDCEGTAEECTRLFQLADSIRAELWPDTPIDTRRQNIRPTESSGHAELSHRMDEKIRDWALEETARGRNARRLLRMKRDGASPEKQRRAVDLIVPLLVEALPTHERTNAGQCRPRAH